MTNANPTGYRNQEFNLTEEDTTVLSVSPPSYDILLCIVPNVYVPLEVDESAIIGDLSASSFLADRRCLMLQGQYVLSAGVNCRRIS